MNHSEDIQYKTPALQLYPSASYSSGKYPGNSSKNIRSFELIVPSAQRQKVASEREAILFLGSVTPDSKVTITEEGFTVSSIFILKNIGETPLRFYTSFDPTGPVPDNTPVLQPGDEDEYTALELGAKGNKFLMVYNPDKENVGDYVVEV